MVQPKRMPVSFCAPQPLYASLLFKSFPDVAIMHALRDFYWPVADDRYNFCVKLTRSS